MPRPSGISVKAIGLIAAGLLTLAFALIIWFSMQSAPAPAQSNADLFPPNAAEIPNIEDSQTGGKMFVTMVDKNDPTRVAATLQADRFEPIGDGQRRLDNPESWIYLADGRAIKITAEAATMLMPDPNEPPESGTLEGNIRIESFASADDLTSPVLVAKFDEPLEFERRYLRLRSLGHFEIVSDQFDFSGSNLTVILNELRDRVELIDVEHGDQIVIRPNAQSDPKSTIASSSSSKPSNEPSNKPTGQSDPQAVAPTPTPAIRTRYHIELIDSIIASVAGSGQATGGRLDLWIALEENTLAPDAIKNISFIQSPKDSKAATSSTTQAGATTDIHPAQSAKTPTEIIIAWEGKMTVRPVDDHNNQEIPPEFEHNDVTMALSANADGSRDKKIDSGITFAIPNQQFVGQAHRMTYYATQGIIELNSIEQPKGIIKLQAQDSGMLMATKLVADLSQGIIDLSGRGSIAHNPVDQEEATIQWNKQALFTLAKIDDAISDRLAHAKFAGNVIAKQAGNGAGAKVLDIDFDPKLEAPISLTKLAMSEGVLSSVSRNMLSGKQLEIEFTPNASKTSVDPISIIADGQVLGRTPDSILRASHLDATLMRDLKGELVIRDARATAITTGPQASEVKYSGPQRTTARGQSLLIDGINETLVLLGAPAKLTQAGSSVTGNHINLNAKRRGIEVIGPGSFDHDITIENQESSTGQQLAGHVRATWKGSMRFDDALGSIVCEDQVKVISTPDAFTRDTLTAHRAEIKLSAKPTNDPIENKPKNATNTASNDRQLISARIFGHAPTGKDPIPAKIESRTYAIDDPERVTGLIYLEGPQVIVDNIAQTLEVPAPGVLLVMDRTQGETQTNSQTSAGLTKFTWQGKMALDRAAGTALFVDQVLVRQKTLATGNIAQLSTDQLDARFEIAANTTGSDAEPTTRLLGVDAIGSVRFLYQNRELIADAAVYDALSDSLFASAIGNKLVTVYDDDKPAPMSAKTMRWDLGIDRIEINAPTPSRTPGG